MSNVLTKQSLFLFFLCLINGIFSLESMICNTFGCFPKYREL